MKRSSVRARARAERQALRASGTFHPSGESKYGRKSRWLAKHDVFGFQVAEPKPWKSLRRKAKGR